LEKASKKSLCACAGSDKQQHGGRPRDRASEKRKQAVVNVFIVTRIVTYTYFYQKLFVKS